MLNKKSISVIIPNYNYSKFLERRINSIIRQTIKPDEIIFLDDCSHDDSVDVADMLLKKSGIPYQVVVNTENQGIFKQWIKGIEISRFDYFWIAEADDYCENNFLEVLLPAFNDNNVVISYSKSKYVNIKNKEFCDENEYKALFLDVSRWKNDYVNTQCNEITNYLSVINTIPNVSAVLFNKQNINFDLVKEVLFDYKKAGDWLFYIISLSSYHNNKISYNKQKLNCYVRHDNSAYISGSGKPELFNECLSIHLYILKRFDLPLQIKDIIFKNIYKSLFNYNLSIKNELLLMEIQTYLRPNTFIGKLVDDVKTSKKNILSVIKKKICKNK